MTNLFNLSFITGVFPSVLKTAKVVPVFKKDSKLNYSNDCPISLLSNIEKIYEKLIYNRPYTFLDYNNIIYDLQFGFRQQYSTSHALKVQSYKLYNNKYMLASTQISNTEIFVFTAVLVFKLLSRKVLFINKKDNRNS